MRNTLSFTTALPQLLTIEENRAIQTSPYVLFKDLHVFLLLENVPLTKFRGSNESGLRHCDRRRYCNIV